MKINLFLETKALFILYTSMPGSCLLLPGLYFKVVTATNAGAHDENVTKVAAASVDKCS